MSRQAVNDVARVGTQFGGQLLPHRERLEAAFGSEHDLSAVRAYLGQGPASACDRLGAAAFPVSHPADVLEREAESVAGRLLPQVKTSANSNGGPEQGGVVDEDCAMGRALRSLPRSESGLERHLALAYGPGRPLESDLRTAVEPLLGYDLGAVRLHPAGAEPLAAHLGARAFTAGRHVYFDRGEYRPEHREGLRVLLHELAHTTQPGAREQPIRRVPRILDWDTKNEYGQTTSEDNCCPSCPKKVGVDSKGRGPASFTNGIELKAYIAKHEPAATYDIKRTKALMVCYKENGKWKERTDERAKPGTSDDTLGDTDECLTPRGEGPHIYSRDAPGFETSPDFPQVTQAVQKATFIESVGITDGSGTVTTDPTTRDWHSTVWIWRFCWEDGCTWLPDVVRSEIGPGSQTVGTCEELADVD